MIHVGRPLGLLPVQRRSYTISSAGVQPGAIANTEQGIVMRQMTRGGEKWHPGRITRQAPRHQPVGSITARWYRWDEWEIFGPTFCPFTVRARDEDEALQMAFDRLERGRP